MKGVSQAWLKDLISRALREDCGDSGDVTSRATVPESLKGKARMIAKQEMVISGLPVSGLVFEMVEPDIRTQWYCRDGEFLEKGCVIGIVNGPVRAILEAETENLKKIAQSAEALNESEAQKQSILDASIDVILYTDTTMKVIWANKRAGEIVNKNPEDLIGHTCHTIYTNSDTPCQGCPGITALETGNSEHKVTNF